MEKKGRESTGREGNWTEIVKRYNYPQNRKSIWQIVNSFGPYVILWILMYYSLGISYWITLGLSVLAAGFLVRMFIIFHDCGHGSFFKSKRANRIVGIILGSFVFTPYDRWHNTHAIHHATVGNLDQRGVGDVKTLTTDEYNQLSKGKQLVYRIYRSPIVLFVIAPFILFVIWFRFPMRKMTGQERRNIYFTNLILAVYITGMILLMGWQAYLLIQLPVIFMATVAGVWLFYVQHQFEDVVWTRKEDWDYKKMALEGSSFLKFPKVLQWFSGNIGFHHIHHLSPMIPNYKLEMCHRENELFSSIKPVTFIPSIKTITFRLWDEKRGKIVSFRQLRQRSAR